MRGPSILPRSQRGGSLILDPYIRVWHTSFMPPQPVIKCKHCPRMSRLTEAGARSIGWRIFSGTSQAGKPLDDVACPVCSGRGPEPVPPSWDVRCLHCGWSLFTYEGDEPDIPVINAADAVKVLQGHYKESGCAIADVKNFQVLLPGDWEWQSLAGVINGEGM